MYIIGSLFHGTVHTKSAIEIEYFHKMVKCNHGDTCFVFLESAPRPPPPPHTHTQGRKMIETKRVTDTAFPMDILYRRKHMRFRYLSHMRKSQMCHPALQVVEGLT